MGMDAHALVAIGFEITQEDFLQPVKDTKKTCDYGHPLPPRDPELPEPIYCSQDGTEFHHRIKLVPTHALKRIAKVLLNEDLDDGDWWFDFADDNDFVFRVGQGLCETLVCGVMFGDSGSHRSGPGVSTISQDEIGTIFEKVKNLQIQLGPAFHDRPIKLYSWLYISA